MALLTGGPPNIADILALVQASSGKPLVRLVQAVAQSIADNTVTALTFSTEDLDTHGFHSTSSNTSRITPTVAGYYRLHGVYLTTYPSSLATMGAAIGKNGSAQAPWARGNPNLGGSRTSEVTAILSANGSTDYFELLAYQDSAGSANTAVGGAFSSVFECEFLRPL